MYYEYFLALSFSYCNAFFSYSAIFFSSTFYSFRTDLYHFDRQNQILLSDTLLELLIYFYCCFICLQYSILYKCSFNSYFVIGLWISLMAASFFFFYQRVMFCSLLQFSAMRWANNFQLATCLNYRFLYFISYSLLCFYQESYSSLLEIDLLFYSILSFAQFYNTFFFSYSTSICLSYSNLIFSYLCLFNFFCQSIICFTNFFLYSSENAICFFYYYFMALEIICNCVDRFSRFFLYFILVNVHFRYFVCQVGLSQIKISFYEFNTTLCLFFTHIIAIFVSLFHLLAIHLNYVATINQVNICFINQSSLIYQVIKWESSHNIIETGFDQRKLIQEKEFLVQSQQQYFNFMKKEINKVPDSAIPSQTPINQDSIAQEQQMQSVNNDVEQQQGNIEQQEQVQEDQLQQKEQDYKNRQNNRGVCYLSRIPPYMKPNYVKKLLTSYLVERVYLLAESQWSRKNRIKRGGNKKICFREGWVEFSDKRMAKLAALTLNGQKMVNKKGNFYSEDVWNLKYLPKFKWHHLTERLAHQQRLKKERLKIQLEQQRKIDQFYSEKLIKSKKINGIVQAKRKRGKDQKQYSNRQFQQYKMVNQIKDQ